MTVQEAQVDDLHESDEEEFVDELTPGTQLMHGQYTIESFLNSGGFGITYLARDSLDRLVVIKECFPGSFCRRQNASVVARSRAHSAELRSIVRLFTQEARSLAKAGHPNVVGVHQVFEDNGTAYMALDYVEGMDLLEIITETPGVLTPTQIRGYLVKMLDAISFVHKQGILHRDISPDNILVRADNEPVLIDFGAAREEASKQSRLLSALRVVKDGYSPQEFYVAGSEQSDSCDLYSLAASFYHIITGDLPPDSQTRLAAAAAGDVDPFVPLGQRTNDYDEVFCSALDKAMSVLPRERIQSAEDWIAMLNGEAVAAAPEAKKNATKRPAAATKVAAGGSDKSKMPILLGSTAAVIAVAAVGYFATQGGSEDLASATVPVETPQIDITDAPLVSATQPNLNDAPIVAIEESAPVTPDVIEVQPSPSVTVVAPTGATQQGIPPSVGAPDEGVDLALAPDLAPALSEDPFVNLSDPASPPVAPVEESISLESLPAGVELVTPEAAVPQDQLPAGVELITPETTTPEPAQNELPAGVELIAPETATLEPAQNELPAGVELIAPETAENQLPAGVELIVPETATSETAPNALPAGVELIVPETPAAQLPAGVELIAPETAALEPAQDQLPAGVELITPEASDTVAPTEPAEVSSVMGKLIAGSLPFTLSETDPGVVETVSPGAPFWLVEGTRILTIEGQPVLNTAQANALAKASDAEASGGTVRLNVTTEAQVSGAAIDRVLNVQPVHSTILLNGLGFESSETESGIWSTVVTAAPSGSSLEAGDEVVAFIPTNERIQGADTLRQIIERDLETGRTEFSFAIQRDGQMWVESFTLTK